MPTASTPTSGTAANGDAAPERPSRRRRTVIASAVVAALVLGSLVWGGVTASQTIAAERHAEAQRVVALGALLADRSASSELLVTAGHVVGTTTESDESLTEHHAQLEAAHSALADELERELTQQAPPGQITVQARMLDRRLAALIRSLDGHRQAVLDHAGAVRAASPLATKSSLTSLATAVSALAFEPQGLPGSYSGRAPLVEAVLTSATAVAESHKEEKAEKERLEAERKKAEEEAAAAARQSAPGLSTRDSIVDVIDQQMIDAGCILIRRSGDESSWDCPDGYWEDRLGL